MKQTVNSSLALAIEVVLLALVVAPAWAFGSVHAPFELWVAYAIGCVLLLSAAWRLSGNHTEWLARPSSLMVAGGLYTLFLIATIQYLPLARGMVGLLSPAAVHERGLLLNQNPEVVRGDAAGQTGGGEASTGQASDTSRELSVAPTRATSSTLSLNPSGSYYFSLRLLALVGLFTAVCGFCRSEVPVKHLGTFLLRLSVVAAIVGTALALFSIAQRFSSPPNKLYWFYDISMHGFGPFINRNHYPFFANMTLGLAVGLLLHRYEKRGSGWANLLINDNAALWIVGAIVFIVAGIVICVSRGGFVAMLAALMLTLVARSRQGENLRTVATFTVVGAAVLTLLGWIGFDFLSSRLTTITDTEAIRESGRFSLWLSALQAGTRFPLVGSGGETYTHWETMLNQTDAWNSSIALATRCDNEFIDLFCEYGIFASLAALLMAGAVLRRGFLLARHNGLAAGAFMALTAVIVHSCMDFGLRVPASAVMATIIAAALCSLKRREHHQHHEHSRRQKRSSSRRSSAADPANEPAQATSDSLAAAVADRPAESERRTGSSSMGSARSGLEGNGARASFSLGSLGVAAACVLVAVFLVSEKRRLASSDWAYRQALRYVVDGEFDRAAIEFVRAVKQAPEDARLHRDIAARLLSMSDATQTESQKLAYRTLAVKQAIVARNQCPLAFEPHLYLGQNHDLLLEGDSQIAYFQRARRLHPSNCDIAFGLGSLLYEAGQFDEAWSAWHASLEFIPNHLPQILDRSVKKLTVEEIIQRVLPEKPALLLRAAEHTERAGRIDESRVYLDRVSGLLEQSANDAASFEMLARVYTQMKATEKAIDAYKKAILLEPGQMSWRMELVKQLIQAERLEEAQREIRSLLVFEPDNVTVQSMKTRVEELMREAKRKK